VSALLKTVRCCKNTGKVLKNKKEDLEMIKNKP
jgi:hypothetical protein